MIWKHMFKAVISISILIGCAIGIWSTPALSADEECRYPLFIQVSGVDANILIIFDSSGSMNSAMYHDAYDQDSTYAGDFNKSSDYSIATSGWYVPADFDTLWPDTPSAHLVDSDHGRDARYPGNYLNWIYYHATEEQRLSIPQFTRIQVAKASIALLINNTEGIRYGLMKFNGDAGGLMVADVGTDKATLLSNLDGIAGDGWTPLAESMVSAMQYFQRTDAGAPIQEWCQRNFLIIITDGYPTQDLDIPAEIGDYDNDGNDPGTCASLGSSGSSNCSDYMDDVALYLYSNDMRSDLDDTQNIVSYVIGFNIDYGILQETADNGDGLYFNANDAGALADALSDVLADIIRRTSSGTAVAVVSTESTSGNRIFRAKFKPGTWQGYFEAFDLPYQENDTPAWEAGSILANMSPNSRYIYTSTDGVSKISFDATNTDALLPYLNTASPDTAQDIIGFVRGNDIAGYRDREGWKLGDIVDSSPVVVGTPAHFYDYYNYGDFREQHLARERVVYIGANDGMIHCFSTETGAERWAYIPKNQLGKLHALMDRLYCHNYYVNGTPKVVDAFVGGSWKTILIGNQREGGNGYFALDVTDPTPANVTLLWDVSLPLVNESWGVPEVARVNNLNKFVAFIGSGPDVSTGQAHLIALDLEDGSVPWSDHLSTIAGANKCSNPAKIDINYDGYDDLLYVGDFAGNLWRIDLRQDPWVKTLLFQANQPIQATPAITLDEFENICIYFGTGKYIEANDIYDTNQQTFYCIKDNLSGSTVARSDLVDQTYGINTVSATDRGWYIDLVQTQGERIIETDLIVAGTVYFTSFRPLAEPCRAGGVSWLYSVDFNDGSAPDNDDGSENDTTEGRLESLGDGIYSEPVLDIINEDIIVQSSTAQIAVKDAMGLFQRMAVSAWRQRFQ